MQLVFDTSAIEQTHEFATSTGATQGYVTNQKLIR